LYSPKYNALLKSFFGEVRNVLAIVFIAVIFLGLLVLLTYYRRGGIVDEIYTSVYSPGLRDVGIYIQASRDLLDQKSPYDQSNLLFRSGSFGVLIFLLFSMDSIGFVLAQVANFCGFLAFGILVLRNRFQYQIVLLFLATAIYFSSFREVFSTGQINGILMGLVAMGIKLQNSNNLFQRVSAAILFAIALDLKPNLFLPFVLATYIYRRKYCDFLLVPLSLIVGSLAVNIYVGKFLQLEWLRSLQQITDPELNPTSTGTKVIWPLLVELFNLKAVPSFAPLLLYAVLTGVLLSLLYLHNSHILWLTSLVIPLSYSYFHLYSFFPIAFLALAFAVEGKMPLLLGTLFSFSFFSGSNFGTMQLLITVFFSAFFILAYYLLSQSDFRDRFLRNFFIVILVVSTLRFSVMRIVDSSPIIDVININILAGVAVTIFYRSAIHGYSQRDKVEA